MGMLVGMEWSSGGWNSEEAVREISEWENERRK